MRRTIFLAAALLSGLLHAQQFQLLATKVEGNIEFKHEGSRKWETLRKNTRLKDNDIVRSSYRSNCEIRFGEDNLVFLGSNSRVLLNFIVKPGDEYVVTITIFAGSAYSKVIRGVDFTAYSATASGKTRQGIFNCTVDEASGVTAFHVFSGAVTASNITVQGELEVRASEMSTITPGAFPTRSKRISAKEMGVLTRHYGSDFINQQIEATGVQIASSTAGPGGFGVVQAQETSRPTGLEATIDRQRQSIQVLTPGTVERKLERHAAEHEWMYRELGKAETLAGFKYRVGLEAVTALYRGKTFLDFNLRPGYYQDNFRAVLNVSVTSDSSEKPGMALNGVREIFDKIYALDYRRGSSTIHVGDIRDLTVGYGISMRRYSNRVYGDPVRNLGLHVHYQRFYRNLDLFTASLADFHLNGIQYYERDTSSFIGIAVIRESGQALNRNRADFGLRAGRGDLPDSLPDDSAAAARAITIGELSLGYNLVNKSPVKLQIFSSFAAMILDDEMNLKGWGLTCPGIDYFYKHVFVRTAFFFNRAYFVRGLFGPFYEDNMAWVVRDTSAGDTIRAANNLASALTDDRLQVGLSLSLKARPFKWLTVGADYEQVVAHLGEDPDDTTDTPPVIALRGRENGSLDLKLVVGQGLTPRLPFAEIYYSIGQSGYFSNSHFLPFSPNPFTTWGGRLFFEVTQSVECHAGYERYYYDADGSQAADRDEGVDAFTAGVTAGF
jgi:hypothetical protein